MRHGRRNVLAVFASTFLVGIGQSVWQGQMFSIFLFKMVVADTEIIGFIEGFQGLAQLGSGLAMGWGMDKLGPARRNAMLQSANVYSLGVMCLCAACVLYGRTSWTWGFCSCLYAPTTAVQKTIVESIFADSVPTGGRVADYTSKRLCQLVGLLVGPLLQLCILSASRLEDAWTPKTLKTLMLVGITCNTAGCLLQFLMDQRDTLGAQSEALQCVGAPPPRDFPGEAEASAAETAEASCEQRASDPALLHDDRGSASPDARSIALERNARAVRWTILTYDIIRVCFGGIAVKYFGLFFTETFGVPPNWFLMLQTLSYLAMVICSKLAERFCLCGFSRTKVCLALLFLNNAGNFTLSYGESFIPDATGWVLREGSLNAVFGLKQTLLMDYTPKANRGMWNSVSTLNSSFWSGSAVVGGILIHHYGYLTNFRVMSWGFCLALLTWSSLLRHAPTA